jgi:hypothetical protein
MTIEIMTKDNDNKKIDYFIYFIYLLLLHLLKLFNFPLSFFACARTRPQSQQRKILRSILHFYKVCLIINNPKDVGHSIFLKYV